MAHISNLLCLVSVWEAAHGVELLTTEGKEIVTYSKLNLKGKIFIEPHYLNVTTNTVTACDLYKLIQRIVAIILHLG